ncbi:glycosyltransferase [Pelagibacterales bacterium SAG-MED22]|nr:glycosyltransferase [Pelagibacterales bacterium SAG-MED22]
MFKRHDLAIINRSFWPTGLTIGESLLQLGEKTINNNKSVVIISQSSKNLDRISEESGRGKGANFKACISRSNSSTNMYYRIFDLLIFTFWVIWSLILTRPKNIYVSTDPPLLIPFVVFLYSKIFRSSYVYHLQDIHPEAGKKIIKLNSIILAFFKKIDGVVIRNASSIITINETMRNEILDRSKTKSHIYLVDNPTANIVDNIKNKIPGFVFLGNAGRLQRIPLLLKSIKDYKEKGGTLPFLFIGEGIYFNEIRKLSREYKNIKYTGLIDMNIANDLTTQYEWALLPIEDEVTKYAFPSKTSSYLSCGSKILSICSEHTSVAKWVKNNNYGINIPPQIKDIVDTFFKIENGLTFNKKSVDRNYYSIENFVYKIFSILFNKHHV